MRYSLRINGTHFWTWCFTYLYWNCIIRKKVHVIFKTLYCFVSTIFMIFQDISRLAEIYNNDIFLFIFAFIFNLILLMSVGFSTTYSNKVLHKRLAEQSFSIRHSKSLTLNTTHLLCYLYLKTLVTQRSRKDLTSFSNHKM